MLQKNNISSSKFSRIKKIETILTLANIEQTAAKNLLFILNDNET